MTIDVRYLIACTLAVALGGCHPAAMKMGGYPDFEVVESIPKETVLDNPGVRNAHDVWLEMIGGATKSIDLEQFYVSSQKGEALDDILSALVAAANRGVQIRFIVDARMHKTYPEPIDSLGRLKNISVRVIDFGKLTGGIQHAKYFIVDGREIFLGSQNFDWRALDHIHEIGVRIRNAPALGMYKEVFETDWQLAGGKTREEALVKDQSERPVLPLRVVEGERDTLVFEPTMSPRGLIPDSEQWDEGKIVQLLDGAKRDAMVQVLTYSPVERGGGRYTVIDSALRRAASRGVAVKLIVSDWSIGSPMIAALKDLSAVPNIQVRYTAIPDYSGGYISFGRVEHCKYLVVDGTECWIGTSNWEKSYFYAVRNLGVVVQSGTIGSLMREIFMKGWDGPYAHPITVSGTYEARPHGEKP